MQDFNAIITRDGGVLHLPWGSHSEIVAHFEVPDNTSLVRQNYWEYDILAPFVDGGGLQVRGVEEPPDVVVRAAAELTCDLCEWHSGRNLRSIPAEWSDVVEHIYQVHGRRTPRYLNGVAGVYFSGSVEHLCDVHIMRLIGSARIGRLEGHSVVESMSGRSRIEELCGEARIKDMRERASIGKMSGRSCVETLCHSGLVEKMYDSARVVLMFGAARVLGLYGQAACGRACDGTVFTADEHVAMQGLLSSLDRYKRVKVVGEGESVFA